MTIDKIINRNFTEITPEYERFAKDKNVCNLCSIHDCYNQVGQSEGNAQNPIFMFIGEALGADEVESVRPFVGRAGQRLRQELRKYPSTFNRKTTLISNVLPCRPDSNVFPRNTSGPYWIVDEGCKKSVTAKELVNFCVSKWLKTEILLVKPKIIITLGAKSLEYVQNIQGIGNSRGSWRFLNEYKSWSIATYHPSYILRCQNDSSKSYVVEDFENDINKIHDMWFDLVNSDERMNMSPEEWKLHRILQRNNS